MPIPELERLRAGAILATYCEKKVPRRSRTKMRVDYRFDGNSVVLFESRPSGSQSSKWKETPIAKFRYLVGKKVWVLYWLDERSQWQRHTATEPTTRLKRLVAEVERDPQALFWAR